MKTTIEGISDKRFIDFYNEIADEVGSNERDYPILDRLWKAMVLAEKELREKGYLKELDKVK